MPNKVLLVKFLESFKDYSKKNATLFKWDYAFLSYMDGHFLHLCKKKTNCSETRWWQHHGMGMHFFSNHRKAGHAGAKMDSVKYAGRLTISEQKFIPHLSYLNLFRRNIIFRDFHKFTLFLSQKTELKFLIVMRSNWKVQNVRILSQEIL